MDVTVDAVTTPSREKTAVKGGKREQCNSIGAHVTAVPAAAEELQARSPSFGDLVKRADGERYEAG